MLAAIGDLVDDVVVHLGGPIRRATDTDSVVTRRRGGSAANVAAIAARRDGVARFVGQVGDDPIGRTLVNELATEGVDTTGVRFRGSTGTIVVLVDGDGERTMLTDRRTCRDLADPSPDWLDEVEVLHVPLYSLADGPLAETTYTLAGWAHDRGIQVSVDLSSVALLERLGVDGIRARLGAVRPAVVFANADEAHWLPGVEGAVQPAPVVVVKRGPGPATVVDVSGTSVDVPSLTVAGPVDSTGAGDAFAAGFLVDRAPGGGARWRVDPVAATRAGHAAAAALLSGRTTPSVQSPRPAGSPDRDVAT